MHDEDHDSNRTRFPGVLTALAFFFAAALAGAAPSDFAKGENDPAKKEAAGETEKETEAQEGERDIRPNDFHFYWNNGIRFETEDKVNSFKFGGRIMNDWAFPGSDSDLENVIGAIKGGSEFRRARLYLSGTVYQRVEFKAQYDFSSVVTGFKDVYVGIKKVPYVGTLRIGHVKEPLGLEMLTSSKYITFMERSLASIFYPERNTGFLVFNNAFDQRLTWSAGAFLNAGAQGNARATEDFNYTARLTGLPFYSEGGRKLLHLGIGASSRAATTLRFKERPEVHIIQALLDTGPIEVNAMNVVDIEAAVVAGPFSVQSEYVTSYVDAPEEGKLTYRGFYAHASFFLTGESRAYKTSSAAFDRVKPRRNFGPEGGPGAWEVAVRYSLVDFNDGTFHGGQMDSVNLGLNWHLNPISRVMFNYVFADVLDAGTANFFQTRFQIDF
ncbi:MAG: hypothetical protein BMS9Abin37_0515 [Acidobacteriota bacterium]|nr:MAG: hypothetical protein BMS9Abin37_0515 [Acidobacteriota bacterium]